MEHFHTYIRLVLAHHPYPHCVLQTRLSPYCTLSQFKSAFDSSTYDEHLQCRLLCVGLTRSCLSLSQTVGVQMAALLPPGFATVNPRPSALHTGFLFLVPPQRRFLFRLWYQVSDVGVCCNQVFLGCQQLQTPLVGHWSVCVVFCGFSPLPDPPFSILSSIKSTWTCSDSASCWHCCTLKQQGTRCKAPMTWPLSPTASLGYTGQLRLSVESNSLSGAICN